MDVTVFGMMTTALQVNVNTVGAEEGATEGAMEGVIDGITEGSRDGAREGATDGSTDGTKEGAMDMVGAEVGVREGGPEVHVDRPEPAHAGYTQAESPSKGVVPNVIPAQYSITAILRL